MTWAYGAVVGLIALCVGSFINVVAYRLPLQMANPASTTTLWRPRSHCPGCNTTLRWWHIIPLASWLMLRGRCHHCDIGIAARYPLVEAATMIGSLLLVWWLPFNSYLFGALLLFWLLLALSLIDIEHLLLPDRLTQPLLWSGLLLKSTHWIPGSLTEAIWGAAAGYATLWLLSCLYHRATGIVALGGGDVKLVAALGAWLGYWLLPWVLLIACSAALSVLLISRILWQRTSDLPIAFGPWIALAGISLFIHSII